MEESPLYVKVSGLQASLQKELPGEMFVVRDSLQAIEHSIEALIPFLRIYNPEVEIIPIIVPYMSFERMEMISRALSTAVKETMDRAGLRHGEAGGR
ncbi:MAG: AmmeMemoRadiSam system protein B [Marinilabiliales bacterium]|nr:AmmeMemoRadiSam system protein B [Marinilabiliales bacterium]